MVDGTMKKIIGKNESVVTAFTSCITYKLHAAYLLYTTSPPSHLDGRLLYTEDPISFFRNPGVARRLLRTPAVYRALF
jgi:hypothetical protein